MILIEILVAALIVLWLIWIAIVVTAPNAVYMFIAEHKEWEMWRYFRKNIHEFKYVGTLLAHQFVWGDYTVFIWEDGLASIHDSKKCVCGIFWKYRSRRFAKKLLKIINEEA